MINNRELEVYHGGFHEFIGCYPDGETDWCEGRGQLSLKIYNITRWIVSYNNTGNYGDAPDILLFDEILDYYDNAFILFKHYYKKLKQQGFIKQSLFNTGG